MTLTNPVDIAYLELRKNEAKLVDLELYGLSMPNETNYTSNRVFGRTNLSKFNSRSLLGKVKLLEEIKPINVKDLNFNTSQIVFDFKKIREESKRQFRFDFNIFDFIEIRIKIGEHSYELCFPLDKKFMTINKNIFNVEFVCMLPFSRNLLSKNFIELSLNSRENSKKSVRFDTFPITTIEKEQNCKLKTCPTPLTIVYKFFTPKLKVYDFGEECHEDRFVCPFCSYSTRLYKSNDYAETLLKRHMKLTHFRFKFNISLQTQSSIIICEIKLNEMFDSSLFCYGNDSAYLGFSNFRMKPVKYNMYSLNPDPNTLFVFYNSEFLKFARKTCLELNDDTETLVSKDLNKIPSRVYYSARTNHVKKRDEYETVSTDDEEEWLKESIQMELSEFCDVNEGEKGLMLLWNLHCMKHMLVADREIKESCMLFIDENFKKLVENCLINNFLLHLANLSEYGFLKKTDLVQVINYFNEKKTK